MKQTAVEISTKSDDLPNWRYNIVKTIKSETSYKSSFKTKELAHQWHEKYLTTENPKELILKELPFIIKDELKSRYQYFLVKSKTIEQPWTGSFETEQEALNWHKKYNDFWLERGFQLKLEKISSRASDTEEKVKITEKTINAKSIEDQIENNKMLVKLGAVNEKSKIKLKASLNN